MEFPITIDSQDKFDDLVKERLAREKTKVDEALQRATDAETAKTAAEQERDALKTEVGELQTKVTGFESKTQLDTWRADVAKTKGVPADVLRGTTKEELEAHADEIKPLIKSRGPVLPDPGKTPENTPTGDEAERAAVRQLFGSESGED